jgi:hypothetical protein
MKKIIFNKGISKEEKAIIKDFVIFCYKDLNIDSDFTIKLVQKQNNYGISTGGFNRETLEIFARSEGRAVVDILRTIAHELVHLNQLELGKIKHGEKVQDIGGPIEDEANAVAGQLIKKFAYSVEDIHGNIYKL